MLDLVKVEIKNIYVDSRFDVFVIFPVLLEN